MDLGAYARIDDLEKVARENGIDVPRLRGYRLMKDESPKPMEEVMKGLESDCLLWCVEAGWSMSPLWREYSEKTEMETRRLTRDGKVRWDLIHGKRRKLLKYRIRKERKARLKDWGMFNSFCGRKDVLYIHARIGGGNWDYFCGDELVSSQPWFISKVDDCWDSTYCNIYARIKVDG